MKSIMQTERVCYICGARHWLELHHVYFGKNRRNSDKNGFTCYLCEAHHRGTYGVHGRDGAYFDHKLKVECQKKYEETHSRKEFMRIIGRNYIEEDEE